MESLQRNRSFAFLHRFFPQRNAYPSFSCLATCETDRQTDGRTERQRAGEREFAVSCCPFPSQLVFLFPPPAAGFWCALASQLNSVQYKQGYICVLSRVRRKKERKREAFGERSTLDVRTARRERKAMKGGRSLRMKGCSEKQFNHI